MSRDLRRLLTYCLRLPAEASFSLYAVTSTQGRPICRLRRSSSVDTSLVIDCQLKVAIVM